MPGLSRKNNTNYDDVTTALMEHKTQGTKHYSFWSQGNRKQDYSEFNQPLSPVDRLGQTSLVFLLLKEM